MCWSLTSHVYLLYTYAFVVLDDISSSYFALAVPIEYIYIYRYSSSNYLRYYCYICVLRLSLPGDSVPRLRSPELKKIYHKKLKSGCDSNFLFSYSQSALKLSRKRLLWMACIWLDSNEGIIYLTSQPVFAQIGLF